MNCNRNVIILLTVAILTILIGCGNDDCPTCPQTTVIDTVLYENFDSYNNGTFPSAGSWVLMNSGAGTQYQVVSNNFSHSGDKSMQLRGSSPNYAADVYHSIDIPINTDSVWFECWLKTPSDSGIEHDDCGLNAKYVALGYDNYRKLLDGLMPAELNTWYKLTMLICVPNQTYTFWVNDNLVLEDGIWTGAYSGFDKVTMHAGWAFSDYYFDDIRVWYRLKL